MACVSIPDTTVSDGDETILADETKARLVADISANIRQFDLLTGIVNNLSSWLEDYYLVRVGWWTDNTVAAQIQNRDQDQLFLLRIDPSTST